MRVAVTAGAVRMAMPVLVLIMAGVIAVLMIVIVVRVIVVGPGRGRRMWLIAAHRRLRPAGAAVCFGFAARASRAARWMCST